MEQRLLADACRNPNLSPESAASALSLITNPFTSDQTLFSLSETLIFNIQDANSNHNKVLSLLHAISHHHPRLRHRIVAAAQEFIYLLSAPTSTLPHALALIDPGASTPNDPFADESLFLSMCFWHCVKTREWVLRNVSKFSVRPSVLLTVLLGLTKDPYPYIREAALDGLVMLGNGVLVDDRTLVEGCYFRAVELLFDAENSVRGAAVRAVSKWGQLLVELNPDKTNGDWPDALFVQLCLMVRDTDMEIRVISFNALGNIQTVSEDILLQTLSKKILAATKGKDYPGQYTAKLFKIPASAAAFTFIHGLEDEFYQVRTSACRALQMLAVLSSKFSVGVVDRLMDMLNDDAIVVRLQALVTLHHIAINEHLIVEESHLHMFLGTLSDNNSLIRSAARKPLQLTKLHKMGMFRSCMDGLIKNLELYPQDEAEIFFAIYKIGQTHGKFVTTIIHQVSEELEPSFDGKLGSNNARTAALLVLAISAPISLERQICSIPPQIYSYAVTLLGRLSCGLVDITDQNTLLAYLSHCSRFTIASSSENLEGALQSFRSKGSHIQSLEKIDKVTSSPVHDYPLNANTTSSIETVLQKIVDLWPLIQLGCLTDVVRPLSNWKEELKKFSRGSCQRSGVMIFALKYLRVIKLLANAWGCYFSRRFKGTGDMEALLCKMERRLKEMLYRFVGLNEEEKLNILELMLVTYAIKASCRGICCFDDCMQKLNIVLERIANLQKEGFIQLSDFAIELQNIESGEIGDCEDVYVDKVHLLQASLNLFSLKRILLTNEVKYLDAEVDVSNNDFQNPYPFIPSLPVGIPVDITLYNVSSDMRLWLAMTLGDNSTQFVFLDLDEFEGCNEIRKISLAAPFYRTPEVKHFVLKVSVAMECCFDRRCEVIYLCKGKEVHLSMSEHRS